MVIIDGRYDYLNLRMGHITSTQHQKYKKWWDERKLLLFLYYENEL